MGEMVQLQSGEAVARLLPSAGGRISALRLVRPGGGAVDVLHPYPEDFFDPLRWAKGGIYPLLPYSNRIANATVRVGGEAVALAAHPDAAPHTLHGNAHAQAWQLLSAPSPGFTSAPEGVQENLGAARRFLVNNDASSAVLALDSAPGPAWPWRYWARMRLELAPDELVIRLEMRNADTRVMPAGLGLHPYFRHQPPGRVGYSATTVWPPTLEFLPGAPRPLQADENYSPARQLPEGGLTHYVGGWEGEALIDLPDGARLRMTADAVFNHLVVHRPDNLAYLCLEPVSHVADGFNLAARGVSGTGARLLAPGESMGGTVRLQLMGEVS